MSVLYALAFPPYRHRLLAWVAMVPFLVAIRRVRATAAVLAAVVFSLVACALTISWIPRAAATYYGQPLSIGIATFLGIALLMVAPCVIAFSLLYRVALRRPSAAAPLIGGSLWVCAEYFRSHALTGNPFVLLGYAQASAPLVRQVADLVGVYGASFLVAAVNVALAEAWRSRRRRDARRAAAGGMAIALLLLTAVLLYGRHRLSSRDEASRPSTPVLLVQGNVDLGSQWRADLYGANLDRYLKLTQEGVKAERPELAVWPENAMTFFLAREPYYQDALPQVLGSDRVQLLAGGPHVIEGRNEFANSAFLIGPDGQIAARYDKEKLLPFAEYFPFPQLDVLRRNFGRVREFTPGSPGPPLPTRAGPAGVLICNEAMFPEIAARRVRAGAEILINLTNDSWIGDPQYAELALDMAVFRAVEQRRYLVRSSTSGPSAIIDPLGEVQRRTEPQTKATLSGRVERRSGATPYATFGDVFVAACALVGLVGVGRGLAGHRVR